MYAVRTLRGFVSDWDADDRPMFTAYLDDAFIFAGIVGRFNAIRLAATMGGVVVCLNKGDA